MYSTLRVLYACDRELYPLYIPSNYMEWYFPLPLPYPTPRPDQRYRWLVSIKKPISVSENTRICSLHFERSEGTVKSLIPTIFPWSIPVKLRHPPAIRNPIPPTKRKHEESPTPSKIAKRKIESHRVNCSVGGKSIEEVRTLSNQHFFLK